MLNNIKHIVDNYLNRSINSGQFIEYVQKLYQDILNSKHQNFDLDIIAIIDYIHLFAYWKWSDNELFNEVEHFQNMILGNINYSYSVFLKLIPDSNDIKSLTSLGTMSIETLRGIFSQRISPPQTVNDIIYNSIYDLVSGTDCLSIEDSDFNCINCGDDINSTQIYSTLYRLMSYYEGESPFYFQLIYDTDRGFIYTVI